MGLGLGRGYGRGGQGGVRGQRDLGAISGRVEPSRWLYSQGREGCEGLARTSGRGERVGGHRAGRGKEIGGDRAGGDGKRWEEIGGDWRRSGEVGEVRLSEAG